MTAGAPVAMGLVGAGPWARAMHAPVLAAGPETRLAAVWSRRAGATEELAQEYAATAASSFDELLDLCEAVAFAVPPDVQADLAARAARAGRAVLLEKPLALTLDGARRLAGAVEDAGVVSQLVLTKRYHPVTRAFVAAARSFETAGARACYLHGAFLSGDFATGWRMEHGALLDLGPHVLDLLLATIGPIDSIRATGDPRHWVELTCEHAGGQVSEVSLSGSVGLDRSETRVDLYGRAGSLRYDTATVDHAECWPILRREFAAAVRSGRSHELDVRHGLLLQTLIANAHGGS